MSAVRHWIASLRAHQNMVGPKVIAGVIAEAQPKMTKLTDNGVRKMVVRLGEYDSAIRVELVIKDPDAFLHEVIEAARWVQTGDGA